MPGELGPMTGRVAVVGGGITGLAAAHRLTNAGAETVLLEASDRLGGKVQTHRIDGFVVEEGPDSFVSGKRHLMDLAAELGVADDVISSRPENAGSYVYSRGELHPLPEGLLLMAPSRLGPVLRSPLLSRRGRLRLLADLVKPRGVESGDESLASFVERRLGREVLERIAQPLVAGIHAAEPETMSLAASFPRFLEMERSHRSLILAAKQAARQPSQPAGVSYFASFAGGMGTIVSALADAIAPVDVRRRARATALAGGPGAYRLTLADGTEVAAGAVILAVPAREAAALLATIAPEAATSVGRIRQVSSAVVTLGFDAADLPQLDGYGFVVPAVEGRSVTGVTFLSQKWDGRAGPGRAAIRVFIGGADGQVLATASEDRLVATARAGLAELAGISAVPIFTHVATWEGGFHQYTLGHLDRVAAAETELASRPGLHLAGAAFHGIGLNECVMSGRAAADAALAALASTVSGSQPG